MLIVDSQVADVWFPPEADLPARLKALRIRAGLSQPELAERMQSTTSSVWNTENRKLKSVPLTRVVAWCRACGVDPGGILTGLEPSGLPVVSDEVSS